MEVQGSPRLRRLPLQGDGKEALQVTSPYRRLASALRVASSVNVSDSRGTLVTNGPMSHSKRNGMLRVKEIASHCT